MNQAVLAARGGDGLGDVVEQSGPGERFARGRGGKPCAARRCGTSRFVLRSRRERSHLQILQHQADVVEHRAFGMIVGRLFASDRRHQFRQDVRHESAFVEQGQPARGVRRGEELVQFVANPLGAHEFDFLRVLLHCGHRLCFDVEAELRGETDRAQQAQVIFREAFVRRADGAEEPGAQILFAAHPVMHLLGDGIVEQRVDREVAADGVLARVTETHGAGASPVLVIFFRAESRDLKLVAALQHDDDTELFADGNSVRKERLDLIGRGVGGHVVIMRLAPEQRIAHAAAGPEGFKSGVAQAADDLSGGVTHRCAERGTRPARERQTGSAPAWSRRECRLGSRLTLRSYSENSW